MNDLLAQVHPTLCNFLLSIRLPAVILDKWDVGEIDRDTCEVFAFGVDFLAASLPCIPSQVVFSLYLGLAVSCTMGCVLLYDIVRDRECIQPLPVKVFSGFVEDQALSASAISNPLIPIKKTVKTLHFWRSFTQIRRAPRFPIRVSYSSNFR